MNFDGGVRRYADGKVSVRLTTDTVDGDTIITGCPGIKEEERDGVKAWVNFNASICTPNCAIRDSLNISSVVRVTSGEFIVNFASPMASPNYIFSGTTNGPTLNYNQENGVFLKSGTTPTTTSFTLRVGHGDVNDNNWKPSDAEYVFVMVVGK